MQRRSTVVYSDRSALLDEELKRYPAGDQLTRSRWRFGRLTETRGLVSLRCRRLRCEPSVRTAARVPGSREPQERCPLLAGDVGV